MVTSIIQKSHLEGADRIDSEYYQPEYLKKFSQLKLINHIQLQEIAHITDGEHGSPIWDEQSDIKYFSAQHVLGGLVDNTNTKTISRIINDRNKRSQLLQGDILLSTVGTVGNAGLITKKNLPANIDRHVARISLKSGSLEPEYLVVFLNSSYGVFQTTREATGNVQLNLFIDKIKTLLVPSSNQPKISLLVKNSFNLKDDSELLYQQAEQLLLKKLGLQDFRQNNNLWSVVNFSEVKDANRIDADYFQQKYKDLISKIENHNAKRLGDLVSLQKGFEPGSEAYQEEGKTFIRVSSISKFGINNQDQKYLHDDLYQKLKDNYEPKVGEILLTKDASPGIAYFVTNPVEGIISGGILKLKIKNKIEGEYLALCLNSIIGKMQAERDAGGSVIVHWKPEQIKNILIPILSEETQQKITDLVKRSHDARKKSKEFLEEAKRKVEEMIEKA